MTILLTLASALVAASSPSPASPVRALQLQLRGEHAAARAEADGVLRSDPAEGRVLLLAACAALEQGDLDAAAGYADRLASATRGGPEVRVLVALLARRASAPRQPLREALLSAWRAAGEPDLGASPLLIDDAAYGSMLDPLPSGVLVAAGAGARLLFAEGRAAPERVLDAYEVAARADREPVVALLAALEALSAQTSEEHVGPVPPALPAALADHDSENGFLALAGWLASAPGDAPLRPEDAAVLRAFASAPKFDYPHDLVREELLVLARRCGPDGTARAARAALAFPSTLHVLVLRAAASVRDSPPNPLALASALDAVAERLRRAPTILERFQGLAIAVRAAELGGEPARIAAANEAVRAWNERYRAGAGVARRLGVWPLAASWSEWTADEVAWWDRLLAQ